MVDYAIALEDDLTTAAQSGRICRSSGQQPSTDGKRRARRPPSRICKHESCEQYVVDQGLCVRHGVRIAITLLFFLLMFAVRRRLRFQLLMIGKVTGLDVQCN